MDLVDKFLQRNAAAAERPNALRKSVSAAAYTETPPDLPFRAAKRRDFTPPDNASTVDSIILRMNAR